MKVLKVLGYILAGILVVSTLLTVIAFGAAGGAYWYFSHNPDLRYTLTFPRDGEVTTVNIFTEPGVLPEKTEKILEEGTFQGHLQVFVGPFSFKLIGLRIGVDVPVKELVDSIVKGMGEKEGQEASQ